MSRRAWIAAAALLTCAFRCGEPVAARVGEEFQLPLGAQAVVGGEGAASLSIVFESVLEDSRCPQGEQCIRAGESRILMKITLGNSEARAVELGTQTDDSMEADVGEFRIRLVALRPIPRAAKPAEKKDYVASLLISKR